MLHVSVVGAGAIAQEAYLPAIIREASATLFGIVDLEEGRARDVANEFGAERWTTAVEDILPESDVLIIATPPGAHGRIARTALKQDVAVFTEKPIALDCEEARDLVGLADERGIHYGISRQYREAPASRVLKTLLQTDTLGTIEAVDVHFGDETNWDFASDYRLDPAQAGGGVLTDKGPHIIDLLLWFFGDDITVRSYADDSYGGLEANVRFRWTARDGELVLVGRVSSTHSIDDTISISGTAGSVTADPGDDAVRFRSEGEDLETKIEASTEAPGGYLPRVERQARRFIETVDGNDRGYVPADNGVQTLELIESCYQQRTPLQRPWETITPPEPVATR